MIIFTLRRLQPLLNLKTILWCSILALGLILRFYQLDLKPFHHDEAIFAMYGVFQYDQPNTAFYKYLPMLNGPILFYLLEISYKLFGVSDFSARFPGALLSSLMLFIPLYYRRYFSNYWIPLVLTAIIATSPLMVYFARFLRHEFLVFWIYLLGLATHFFAPRRWKLMIYPLLLSLHWCVKENVFVFLAILLGYVFFYRALRWLQERRINFYPQKVLQDWQWLLAGIMLASALFWYFYTAAGRYPQGWWAGLTEGFTYWSQQHGIERIKGPFSMHLLMLTWYELATMSLLAVLLFWHAYQHFPKHYWKCLSAILILSFVAGGHYPLPQFPQLIEVLKLKNPLDLGFCLFLALFSLLQVGHLIWYRQGALALLNYLFLSHFFTYSYLGEKVPWLALYPLLFALILIAVYLQRQCHQFSAKWWVPLLITIVSYNGFYAYRTAFERHSDFREYLIQVHPQSHYKNELMTFAQQLKNQFIQPKLLLLDDSSWINFWYLHPLKFELGFDPNAHPLQYYDGIIATKRQLSLVDHYQEREISYAGWWVVDERLLSLERIADYAFTHQAWNESGHLKIFFYLRKH